jgi:hypothetical protein
LKLEHSLLRLEMFPSDHRPPFVFVSALDPTLSFHPHRMDRFLWHRGDILLYMSYESQDSDLGCDFSSQRSIPLMFSLGSAVPADFRVCSEFSCSVLADRTVLNNSICTGDEGVELIEADGQYRIDVSVPPGNCSLSSAVFNGEGQLLTDVAQRAFRVSDEQAECPPDSGVTCLHGECTGRGPTAACACDPGYGGAYCSRTEAAHGGGGGRQQGMHSGGRVARDEGRQGQGGVERAYVELVKAGLLDTLYETDRPGETRVVARSMVGRGGLDRLQALVEQVPSVSKTLATP